MILLWTPARPAEDADLTQTDVGKILNTTQQQYAKYELGVQEIPTHHLITLADYYQVSLDYMVGRAEWADVEQWRNKHQNDAVQCTASIFYSPCAIFVSLSLSVTVTPPR